MLFFLLNMFIQGLKIHQNSLEKKEDSICPTYYPGLYIKSTCQSIGKNYTTGSAEPAYRADSVKAGFSITLSHCNYSKYNVCSGFFFSLININGSRAVKLNVNSCRFIDNKMIHTETGVFFLSKGPHQATIDGCTFINNQGAKNSILGETCAKLTMNDCYIAHNIANDRQGQIHVSSLPTNINSKFIDTKDDFQLTFSNLVFYMNIGYPIMNQNNIMLIEDYTSISFKNCSFTCGNGESKNMIGLKGKNIEISFTDCCFYVNYSFYTNYYHIFFDTGSSGHATFSGQNSFSGNKQNTINKNLAETDNEIYNIKKCLCELEEPTETQTQLETDIETSEIIMTSLNPTSKIIPTATPTSSPTETGSNDCENGFVLTLPFLILCLVAVLILIIIAFIAGWFLSKRHYDKEDDQNPLKSDLLFSQQE